MRQNEEGKGRRGICCNDVRHWDFKCFAPICFTVLILQVSSAGGVVAFSSSFTTDRSFVASNKNIESSCQVLYMKLRVGILGLPNVGKSSLFNAMARQSLSQAANYPFCTIDPTSCLVPCHDEVLGRLVVWSSHSGSPSTTTKRRQVTATMEWVDVAGLAKNAHRGDGLGNQFLGTLRDCTCLCHLVRAFDDPQILVHQSIMDDNDDSDDESGSSSASSTNPCDPLRDIETIQLELLLADHAHVQRRLERFGDGGAQDPTDDLLIQVMKRILKGLDAGIPARHLGLTSSERFLVQSMGLLTLKPVIYAWNVDEVDFFFHRDAVLADACKVVKELESSCGGSDDRGDNNMDDTPPQVTLVSAAVEAKIASLSTPKDQAEYLRDEIGVEFHDIEEDSSTMIPPLCYQVLPDLIRQALGYSLVYTGPGVPTERSSTIKSHLIPRNSLTAYDLAGRIHGEIQKGFLRAQVVDAKHLLTAASDWNTAKEMGILRAEGKEYILQDGEVVLIQWKSG